MKNEHIRHLIRKKKIIFVTIAFLSLIAIFVSVYWSYLLSIVILIPVLVLLRTTVLLSKNIYIVSEGEFTTLEIIDNEKKILSRGMIKYFPTGPRKNL